MKIFPRSPKIWLLIGIVVLTGNYFWLKRDKMLCDRTPAQYQNLEDYVQRTFYCSNPGHYAPQILVSLAGLIFIGKGIRGILKKSNSA